ncbi:MAG: hypothetical protein ACFB2Z_00795 [Maricaulaceae bacterium]
MDAVIPMVFPDYKIVVKNSLFTEDSWAWNDIEFDIKLNHLGHAGVLLIRGKDGFTKYYEYGRFDPKKTRDRAQ